MQHLQPIVQTLHATHAAVVNGDNSTDAQAAALDTAWEAFDTAWKAFAEALSDQLCEWFPEKAANLTADAITTVIAEMGCERMPGCANPIYCPFESGIYVGELINEMTRRAYNQ